MKEESEEKTETTNGFQDIAQENEGNYSESPDNCTSEEMSEGSDYELNVFLYTVYQKDLEKAEELFKKVPEEEKTPFKHKYEARTILQNLLGNKFISIKDLDSPTVLEACSNGIVLYKLGLNYSETEEYKDAETTLNKSLRLLNLVPNNIKNRYINIIQDLYNTLGIIHSNWTNYNKGLPLLHKAEQIYSIVKGWQGSKITQTFHHFLKNRVSGSEISNPSEECFGFFIDGGLDKEKLELNYTQTLFYLAQVYSKHKDEKKGAEYCGLTMDRQLKTNTYEIKDWGINALSLGQYYITKENFEQALYLLYAGLTMINKAPEKHYRLRASFYRELGQFHATRLKYMVNDLLTQKQVQYQTDESQEEDKGQYHTQWNHLNFKSVFFQGFGVGWPQVNQMNGLEDAKLLFRFANTQFRKALKFYVLDGYVTDHVKIIQQISTLLKFLAFFENDKSRLRAMLERRKDLLEPILKTINHKAFQVLTHVPTFPLLNSLLRKYGMNLLKFIIKCLIRN
jgi:KIF-binding protein